jgi:hypothetical protein
VEVLALVSWLAARPPGRVAVEAGSRRYVGHMDRRLVLLMPTLCLFVPSASYFLVIVVALFCAFWTNIPLDGLFASMSGSGV